MTKIYLAMVNQYMQMQGKGNTFVFLSSFKLKVLMHNSCFSCIWEVNYHSEKLILRQENVNCKLNSGINVAHFKNLEQACFKILIYRGKHKLQKGATREQSSSVMWQMDRVRF